MFFARNFFILVKKGSSHIAQGFISEELGRRYPLSIYTTTIVQLGAL